MVMAQCPELLPLLRGIFYFPRRKQQIPSKKVGWIEDLG
jgi:hypothetical protein